MRGKGLPYYGQIHSATIPREAYNIWLTRNNELADTEPFGMSCFLQTDPNDAVREDYIRRLLDAANLKDDEIFVLRCRFIDGMTLQETADELRGVCRERIRQIEGRALRRLRSTYQKQNGGIWHWRETWCD